MLRCSEGDHLTTLLAYGELGGRSGTPPARRAIDALPAVRTGDDHLLGTLEPRAIAAPHAGGTIIGSERHGLCRPTGRRERGEGGECGEALADRRYALREPSEMLGPEACTSARGGSGRASLRRQKVELGKACLQGGGAHYL